MLIGLTLPILAATLCSCDIISGIFIEKSVQLNLDSTQDVYCESHKIDISNYQKYIDKAKEDREFMDSYVEKDDLDDWTSFVLRTNDFIDNYYKLMDMIGIGQVKVDMGDISFTEDYNTLYSEFNSLESYITKTLFRTICDKPNFLKEICEDLDMTVEEFVSKYGATDIATNEAIVEAQSQINAIQLPYNYGQGKTKEERYEVIEKIVSLNKRLATLNGYDSYMDYAYLKEYNRDYMPSATNDFIEYLKDYMIPLAMTARDQYVATAQMLSTEDNKKMVSYANGYFGTKKGDIDSYMEYMGSKMNNVYKNLWKTGHYYFSNKPGAYTGAYTWLYSFTKDIPLMYFGPGYQNVPTIVHEFGHYFQLSVNPDIDSLDLREVHSQGDEWLFYSYMANNNYKYTNWYEAFYCNRLYLDLASLIKCASVDIIEQEIYKNSYTKNSYDIAVNNMISTLSNDDSNTRTFLESLNIDSYWNMVVVGSPGYYISYSMSLVPSLILGSMANDDMNKARDCYLKLVDKDIVDGFINTLNNAGINNPFDKQTYQYMKDNLLK